MPETHDILILGGGGQVATALCALPWAANMRLHAPPRAALDVADEPALARTLASRPWGCIVNCAAFTNVDGAEGAPGAAWQANAVGPAHLALLAERHDVPLIHLSTDYVFDGRSERPYRPEDPVRPLGVYGASKAAGETAVRRHCRRHVILRTSWVVSPFGRNFVLTMLRMAGQRDYLNVVADQHGRPTSALDLAATVRTMVARLTSDEKAPTGTFHFANAGATTWHALASAVMDGARRRGAKAVPVKAIATSDWPTPVERPARSILDTSSLTQAFGITPRPWQEALEEILDRSLQGAS